MRHGNKINHLGRTASHRKALLKNLAGSLILHKRITTTVAKAKALRKFVEPIINRSKDNTTHSRRVAFDYLQNKDVVKALFDEVADKVGNRNGGYTRIIRLGGRLGDNAEMCLMELVDFNETYTNKDEAKTKTRRSRRSKKKAESADAGAESATTEATAPTEEGKE